MRRTKTVKVLLADPEQIYREGLKVIIQQMGDQRLELAGEGAGTEEIFQLLRNREVDLFITELQLPGGGPRELLRYSRQLGRQVRSVLLTRSRDMAAVRSAVRDGVNGVIFKTDPVEIIEACVRAVMEGKSFLSPALQTEVEIPAEPNTLTRRELEILQLISRAMNNKQIARELYISDQTVSVHRKNIMRKLGVSNTAGLIRLAYDMSLIG